MTIRDLNNVDYKTFQNLGEPKIEEKPTVLEKIKKFFTKLS